MELTIFIAPLQMKKIDDNYSMNFENNNKITLNEYVVSKIYNIKLSKDKKSKMKTSKEQVSLKKFHLKILKMVPRVGIEPTLLKRTGF